MQPATPSRSRGFTRPLKVSRSWKRAGASPPMAENDLPEQRRISLAAILLRQFKSPLIYVLGVAAVLAGALEDLKDALFIVGVLAINAVLGGYQEFKAERSSLALRRLLNIRARACRFGAVRCCSSVLQPPSSFMSPRCTLPRVTRCSRLRRYPAIGGSVWRCSPPQSLSRSRRTRSIGSDGYVQMRMVERSRSTEHKQHVQENTRSHPRS